LYCQEFGEASVKIAPALQYLTESLLALEWKQREDRVEIVELARKHSNSWQSESGAQLLAAKLNYFLTT
jgi:hypothetical protein